MMANDTFSAKWSDKRMEEDEGLRTVECLRGRLLAERAASKAANDESEQIGKRVTELEKQLEMEIKSRNKAEKRLKYLMKKLDSLNISYVSADESSSFSEKSEISSVSSSSKSQDQNQRELQKPQFSDAGERHKCPSHEDHLRSVNEAVSGDSNENVIHSCQKDDDEDASKKDYHNGSESPITKTIIDYEEHHQDTNYNINNSMALVPIEESAMTTKHDEDCEDNIDNSMALVVVDSIVNDAKSDVLIPTGNVKDVLDTLRYARESLRSSMEMRRRIRSNVARDGFNSIPC